jgi:hypothetical protein
VPSEYSVGPIGGRLRYQKDQNVLFLCAGSAVGLVDPDNLMGGVTTIWNAPAGGTVSGCSVRRLILLSDFCFDGVF